MTTLYLYAFTIFNTFLLSNKETSFCSCWPLDSQEEEYRRSNLVIQGRIIASENYLVAHNIYQSRKGVKFGKSRFKLDSSNFIRHTIVVERNFKSAAKLADTVYLVVKRHVDCGPYIENYSEYLQQELPQVLNLFIYADNFREYRKIEVLKGKKNNTSLVEIIHDNIFFGERCRRIQRWNKEELAKLENVNR